MRIYKLNMNSDLIVESLPKRKKKEKEKQNIATVAWALNSASKI